MVKLNGHLAIICFFNSYHNFLIKFKDFELAMEEQSLFFEQVVLQMIFCIKDHHFNSTCPGSFCDLHLKY